MSNIPINGSYNKPIILKGADPKIIQKLFKFGSIYAIYPSEDLVEIKDLPDIIQ